MKTSLYILCIIVTVVINFNTGFSQDLCTDSSFEPGGFDINTSTLCATKILNVVDNSGNTNIKYLFNYSGETLEYTSNLASPNTSYNYSGYINPKVVTILQIGLKNGKTSIKCKSLPIKINNQAEYSYSVCSFNTLEINVPNSEINDFDSYVIELGAGQTPINVNKADLPYSIKKNLVLPRLVRVVGKYNDATKNCPTNVPFRVANFSVFLGFGIDKPYYPKITRIELITTTKARIDFTGSYSNIPSEQYQLFRHTKGNLATPIVGQEVIKDIKPGQHIVDIPVADQSYCFYVQRKDICSVLPERSAEICTMPLKSVTFVPKRYNLVWDKYPDRLFNVVNSPFLGTVLTTTQFIIKNQIGVFTRINTPNNSFTRTDANIDCKKRYCYQVRQFISGQYRSVVFTSESISNQICVDRTQDVPFKITDAYVTTNALQQNEIKYNRNGSWLLAPEKWFLYKEQKNIFEKIDSANSNVLLMTDNKAIKKSENYKIGYRDECNSVSELTDDFSSLFLSYKLPNELNWSKGVPFATSKVKDFNVVCFDELTNNEKPPLKINNTEFKVNANIDANEIEAQFYIYATSNGTPTRISKSNLITIPILPQIYFPTAMTPNNDGINEVLMVKGKIKRIEKYKFEIYNRFGEKIAELNDLTSTWDGTHKGKPIQVGEYFYTVNATLNNGEKYFKKGSITILR